MASIELNTTSAGTRVQRVRHELKRRELEVARVQDLSPHFRSITFAGESLADFNSASFDDHVKLILDVEGAAPVMRDYTPRHWSNSRRELTIEFALHGDGPAASWAAAAAPGQRVVIGGPRGSFIIPVDYEWHLLVGDETALPAVARRLEELPPHAKVTALLQVNAADRRDFERSEDRHVHWASDEDELLAAVRSWTLPPGEGYVWCAAEARVAASVRRILIDEKGHDRHGIRAAAYWKQGAAAHHENIEAT